MAAELLFTKPRFPTVDVSKLPFVTVQSPRDQGQVQQYAVSLQLGEAEALTLAAEVQATLVLIDERKGRSAVKRLGFRPVGTLGILVGSKHAGHLTLVGRLIDRLQQDLWFFVSAHLKAQVLHLAGE